MIPILYEANETAFRSNGIGRLVDCLRWECTEEKNGIFEVEFDYPITGQHYGDIIEGRIAYGLHDDSKVPQPFDIYGRSAPIDGVVTFFAHHISYRLQYSILQPFSAASCAAAFAQMAGKCVTPCPFTFWTDKTTSGNFNVSAPVSVKEILGGVQGSILDVYGKGEYEWDKFTVKLHLNRGTNTGVQIRYGKNLVGLTQDVDTSGFYSAVVPFWRGGDDGSTLVTLPEWVVQSTAASGGSVPSKAVPLDLSDQWEEAPTVAQLRAKALERVNSAEAWLPDENIKVDFVALWQTDEYANIAPLERVRLCDRVGVIDPELGLTAEGVQAIKTVYDGLDERYLSMELGTARTSFASVVQAAAEAAILPQVPSKSYIQAVVDELSAEIAAGQGGIIYDVMDANGNRTEMLILCDEGVTADTPPEQCQHIWRINKAGIGYSSDYGRTYNLAITASGQIVADFITTGTMRANIIRGGTLALGGANNGNGVFVLLDGNGNEVGRMDNTGANITGVLKMRYVYSNRHITTTNLGPVEYKAYSFVDHAVFTRYGEGLCTKYEDKNNVNPTSQHVIIPSFDGEIIEASNGSHVSYTAFSNNTAEYYTEFKKNNRFIMRLFRSIDDKCAWLQSSYDGFQYNRFSLSSDTRSDLFMELVDSRFIAGKSGTFELIITSSGGTLNGSQIAVASSSSRRYKHSINPLIEKELDPHRLYHLPVVQFIYNENRPLQYADMKGQTLPGFLAEDVEVVYPAAVIHGPDGQVESWDERRIIPGLLALVQEQKQKIDALTARVEKLERMVAALVD